MAIPRSAALAPPRRGAAATPGVGPQRPVRARWSIPARRKPPARHRPPFGCTGALPMHQRRVNPMLPPAQHRVAPGVAIAEMPVERPFRHTKIARDRLDPESGGAPRHQRRHPRRDPVFPPELPHQAHIWPFRSRAARPFAPSCPERPCNKVNRIAAAGPRAASGQPAARTVRQYGQSACMAHTAVRSLRPNGPATAFRKGGHLAMARLGRPSPAPSRIRCRPPAAAAAAVARLPPCFPHGRAKGQIP